MRNHFLVLLFLGVLVLGVGCASDSEEELVLQGLDEELNQVLTAASNGEGIAFFEMPHETELNKIPQDPNNKLTPAKITLGKMLFHETALALDPIKEESTGTYSCASCHHVQGGFQACVPQGMGDGGIGFGLNGNGRIQNPEYEIHEVDVQPIRSPSALNVAYQQVMLWNGQFGATGMNEGTSHRWNISTPISNNFYGFEGVETQALAGLNVHRMVVDKEKLYETAPEYEALFNAAFPEYPETNRVTRQTAALAIAAYERTLLANQSPFQLWLKGNKTVMTDREKEGAVLFFGKAECAGCHTGPALNSMAFHGIGMKNLEGEGVLGYDPTKIEHLGRGGFTGIEEDLYKFKVPQLYNMKLSPFYGHGATIRSLKEMVEYKNNAVPENAEVPIEQLADEFQPLNLTEEEIDLIVEFLETGLEDKNLSRYLPTELPSGLCFPNADPISSDDLGCN